MQAKGATALAGFGAGRAPLTRGPRGRRRDQETRNTAPTEALLAFASVSRMPSFSSSTFLACGLVRLNLTIA